MIEIGYSAGMGRVFINANGSEYVDLPTARAHLQALSEAVAKAEMRRTMSAKGLVHTAADTGENPAATGHHR